MPLALHIQWSHALPRLTAGNYRETSPASWNYNCIAWAAGAADSWWWPQAGRYWPPNVPREETIAAFIAVFSELGYEPAYHAALESSFEKVALYAIGALPTHAARQLNYGWWTSKLGPSIDIEHELPESVVGGVYGEVAAILKRKRTT